MVLVVGLVVALNSKNYIIFTLSPVKVICTFKGPCFNYNKKEKGENQKLSPFILIIDNDILMTVFNNLIYSIKK
jgi:hypothetical protein